MSMTRCDKFHQTICAWLLSLPPPFFLKLVIKNSELVNSFAIIIKQSDRKLSLHIDPKARVID